MVTVEELRKCKKADAELIKAERVQAHERKIDDPYKLAAYSCRDGRGLMAILGLT